MNQKDAPTNKSKKKWIIIIIVLIIVLVIGATSIFARTTEQTWLNTGTSQWSGRTNSATAWRALTASSGANSPSSFSISSNSSSTTNFDVTNGAHGGRDGRQSFPFRDRTYVFEIDVQFPVCTQLSISLSIQLSDGGNIMIASNLLQNTSNRRTTYILTFNASSTWSSGLLEWNISGWNTGGSGFPSPSVSIFSWTIYEDSQQLTADDIRDATRDGTLDALREHEREQAEQLPDTSQDKDNLGNSVNDMQNIEKEIGADSSSVLDVIDSVDPASVTVQFVQFNTFAARVINNLGSEINIYLVFILTIGISLFIIGKGVGG